MGIVKYWKNHKLFIFLILCLLVLQAYCDLALPTYTADLVDVGITNSGIEYAVPEKMSKKTFERISLFLSETDVEKLHLYYYPASDGTYRLTTKKEKNLKSIDEMLKMPLVMAGTLSNSEEAGQGLPIDQLQMAYENGQMTKQDLLNMMNTMENKMGEYGGNLIGSQAVAVMKKEYQAIGVDTADIQKDYLIRKGSIMILYAVVAMLCAILAGLLASLVGAGIGKRLRNQMFRRVISFSNTEMDHFQTSSLITRSTNDIQQIQNVTILLLRMVLYAPILAIGGIVRVLQTDTGLDWIIVVAVVVLVGFVFLLMGIAMPKFKIMQTLIDRLNLVAREILTGVLVIRAFGREEEEEKRFEAANRKLTKTQLFTNRVMTFMMPVMMLVMNGVTVLIVWMGAKGIDAGRLQVGDMMAFITYTIQIILSFLMLTMLSIMLPRASVASRRINEVLDTPSSIQDDDGAAEQDERMGEPEGRLEFDHVSFRYPGASEDALEEISFKLEPGTTTAIIGSTGCGKSTLVHLITRFYDVTKGCIRLDGVDIRRISQHKLREYLGFVPQKAVLFSGTIASNIKFAGDQIHDEMMIEAAGTAQAREFIEAKKKGYLSEISQGGSNVSGGQKQRLSIARAIAKKPKILLFDDSFSALDYKTDVTLRKALKERLSDASVLIVAQRISTILHADQIIVLEEGQIAGMGTHQELMKNCEAYQEIARSQLSEKELEGGRA